LFRDGDERREHIQNVLHDCVASVNNPERLSRSDHNDC